MRGDCIIRPLGGKSRQWISCGRAPQNEQGERTLVHRLEALDGLRGLAIGGVLLHHAVSWTGGPTWVGGHHGVTLFFVISGFLITSILLAERAKTGNISLRWFYARRTARIV